MQITWLGKDALMAAVMQVMQPAEVVLDIGCGIRPQNFVRPLVHICCEPYQEYVAHLQQELAALEYRDRSYVVLSLGWADVVKYFPEKSVDSVFLVDVIEHLDKEEGRNLLAATENIARKQTAIFTPLGFMPQHHAGSKDAWGLNGAEWQEHKSGWLPEDFGDPWQILAAREFHSVDSISGQPLEKPVGAFWAIRTHEPGVGRQPSEREAMFRNREINLERERSMLLAKEAEINSLISARAERKIRRILKAWLR